MVTSFYTLRRYKKFIKKKKINDLKIFYKTKFNYNNTYFNKLNTIIMRRGLRYKLFSIILKVFFEVKYFLWNNPIFIWKVFTRKKSPVYSFLVKLFNFTLSNSELTSNNSLIPVGISVKNHTNCNFSFYNFLFFDLFFLLFDFYSTSTVFIDILILSNYFFSFKINFLFSKKKSSINFNIKKPLYDILPYLKRFKSEEKHQNFDYNIKTSILNFKLNYFDFYSLFNKFYFYFNNYFFIKFYYYYYYYPSFINFFSFFSLFNISNNNFFLKKKNIIFTLNRKYPTWLTQVVLKKFNLNGIFYFITRDKVKIYSNNDGYKVIKKNKLVYSKNFLEGSIKSNSTHVSNNENTPADENLVKHANDVIEMGDLNDPYSNFFNIFHLNQDEISNLRSIDYSFFLKNRSFKGRRFRREESIIIIKYYIDANLLNIFQDIVLLFKSRYNLRVQKFTKDKQPFKTYLWPFTDSDKQIVPESINFFLKEFHKNLLNLKKKKLKDILFYEILQLLNFSSNIFDSFYRKTSTIDFNKSNLYMHYRW